MANVLDKTGRLDDETIRVVEAVLYSLHPPTNPAVLLRAMAAWYSVHGGGSVLKACAEWLAQRLEVDMFDFTPYREGQQELLEKTGFVSQLGDDTA